MMQDIDVDDVIVENFEPLINAEEDDAAIISSNGSDSGSNNNNNNNNNNNLEEVVDDDAFVDLLDNTNRGQQQLQHHQEIRAGHKLYFKWSDGKYWAATITDLEPRMRLNDYDQNVLHWQMEFEDGSKQDVSKEEIINSPWKPSNDASFDIGYQFMKKYKDGWNYAMKVIGEPMCVIIDNKEDTVWKVQAVEEEEFIDTLTTDEIKKCRPIYTGATTGYQ